MRLSPDSKIFVAGHGGLVGSAILRRLQLEGFVNLSTRSRADLDLSDGKAVDGYFAQERPEYVFLAAAKVGGIAANESYPADFLRENLAIQLNVIDASHRFGASKLLFLPLPLSFPSGLRMQTMRTLCVGTTLETTIPVQG